MLHGALAPAAALLSGAAAGWTIGGAVPLAVAVAVLAWAGAAVLLRGRAERRFVAAALTAFVACGAALGGTARTELRTPLLAWYAAHREAEPPTGGPRRVVLIEGRLGRDALPTDYGASLVIDVDRVIDRGREVAVRGGVRASVGGRFVEARMSGWRVGRRVRMPVALRWPPRYANFGTSDQSHRLQTRGVSLLGSVKSALLVQVMRPAARRAEWAAAVRARVRGWIARSVGVHSARSGGIVTAVLIGDRAGLDAETTRRLQEAGTYHVIAISGGNIAVLAGLLVAGFRLAGAGRRAAAFLAAVRPRCLRGGGRPGAVRRSRHVHRRHVPARPRRRSPDPPAEYVGARGRRPRGGLAGATGRSGIPAHVRCHPRPTGRPAPTCGIGGRVNRGGRSRTGRPLGRAAGDPAPRGDDLCRGGAAADRGHVVLAHQSRRARAELRRHPADDGDAARRDGGGRAHPTVARRCVHGRVPCPSRSVRHRGVDPTRRCCADAGRRGAEAVSSAGGGLLRRLGALRLRPRAPDAPNRALPRCGVHGGDGGAARRRPTRPLARGRCVRGARRSGQRGGCTPARALSRRRTGRRNAGGSSGGTLSARRCGRIRHRRLGHRAAYRGARSAGGRGEAARLPSRDPRGSGPHRRRRGCRPGARAARDLGRGAGARLTPAGRPARARACRVVRLADAIHRGADRRRGRGRAGGPSAASRLGAAESAQRRLRRPRHPLRRRVGRASGRHRRRGGGGVWPRSGRRRGSACSRRRITEAARRAPPRFLRRSIRTSPSSAPAATAGSDTRTPTSSAATRRTARTCS